MEEGVLACFRREEGDRDELKERREDWVEEMEIRRQTARRRQQ